MPDEKLMNELALLGPKNYDLSTCDILAVYLNFT